jgi:hypothetical protein
VILGAQSRAAPPAGFTVLFNGRDLSGWRGRPGGGGVFSPYVEAKFTPEERAAKQKEWNDDRDLHRRVDTAKNEIVSDGKGVWVTLNGKPVVVGQVLDNFFDRAQPVLPTGSIELQTHGSEVRFRNIYVREIPDAEGKALLATVAAAK